MHWVAGVAAIAAVAAAACGGPAVAQTSQPQSAATTPGADGAQPGAPREAVINALTATRESIAALNQYLTGGGATPEDVTQRATQLIESLSQQRGVTKPEELLKAIDRVTALASRSIAKAEVIQLAVETGFRPRRGALAFDFGPPDGPVHQGFERIVPGDSRVKGSALSALRRPAESDLLSDGLAGVERIEIPVRDGSYRIVLMTQNLGEQQLSSSPFGVQIRVNGIPVLVSGSRPAEWRSEAMLTNSGVDLVGSSGRRAGGFLTGNIGDRARALAVSQQGGAIVLEARSDQKKIVVEFIGAKDTRSYLTGMMIEPADETSDLVLSPEAQRALVPLDVRLALEARIVAAAATVIEQIAPPEAGRPDLRDLQLPEPELETAEVVSES